ncbi:Imm47 family immunity protein [Priestia endophytica]|uniref:Imm47 family immunity protein n=1 Tax=Priestia endophytica TaxID=135735 RepID=UPI001559D23A|nr:Imm47 family immunity protein [Priestia endophytica]
MITVNELIKSIWYGPAPSAEEAQNIKGSLQGKISEEECLISLIQLFKSGDFSLKHTLIHLMNSTKDEKILNLCIHVFCSVCTHEDLRKVENLNFLSRVSEDNAYVFASCARETLSPEVVPYLLALLDEWDDTGVEEVIRDSLDGIMDYTEELDWNASVEEIGSYYIEWMNTLLPTFYYYNREPVFPGNLTKSLVQRAFTARERNKQVKMESIHILLSVWSGKKCPVQYETLVDEEVFQQLTDYINTLSERSWERGRKYFYGHIV